MDKYLGNSSNRNLFSNADDDDNIDDETFLRHPQSGSTGYMLPHDRARGANTFPTNTHQDLESQRQELAMKRREIEDRTLQSSERGLGLLYESEKVGLATAEELTRQKEQLVRTEERLDDINSTLRNSEKHIQGIKSVFGSIRNYFSGRNAAPAQVGQATQPQSSRVNNIQGGVNNLQQEQHYQDHHPAVRNRPGMQHNPPGSVDEALDRNLDDMANGLSRLKGLAQGLNEELNDHNDLIDRVNYKTENVGFKVEKQNKDMGKILGKK
jgi:synaptosomal-associated protein 29